MSVRFRYKDCRYHLRHKVMHLASEELIGRFLLHILPAGLMRICQAAHGPKMLGSQASQLALQGFVRYFPYRGTIYDSTNHQVRYLRDRSRLSRSTTPPLENTIS